MPDLISLAISFTIAISIFAFVCYILMRAMDKIFGKAPHNPSVTVVYISEKEWGKPEVLPSKAANDNVKQEE